MGVEPWGNLAPIADPDNRFCKIGDRQRLIRVYILKYIIDIFLILRHHWCGGVRILRPQAHIQAVGRNIDMTEENKGINAVQERRLIIGVGIGGRLTFGGLQGRICRMETLFRQDNPPSLRAVL